MLIKDSGSIRQQFDKCFKKFEQPTSTYNKRENMYLVVPVNNKFYFNGPLSSIVMDALFGKELEKFTENEKVSKDRKGKVATYHIFAKDRVKEILSVSDVDLSQYTSYNLEEVNHSLCSYATIVPVGHSTPTSLNCYGIEHDNFQVHFIANNYDNSHLIHVYFMKPLLHKQVLTRDCDGNPKKVTYKYIFENNALSVCENYKIRYFCPVVLQINKDKMTLKLVASRCSINDGKTIINTQYSSQDK